MVVVVVLVVENSQQVTNSGTVAFPLFPTCLGSSPPHLDGGDDSDGRPLTCARFLLPGDDVFDYNAWDHVDADDEYIAFTEAQLALQRASPVSAFDKGRFNADPARWWNTFYKNNRENFFKDRKWLQQEFPVLAAATSVPAAADPDPVFMVELGCGVGNTLFPVLQHNLNPRFRIHACDFAPKAVDLVREHPLFREHHPRGTVDASVYDLAVPDSLPDRVLPASVDVVIMVFVFSALAPEQWAPAIANVRRMLKPGGVVLFRDYGRGDLAQVRFKAGRYLDENFYIRGDGTRVYFFDEDELRCIFAGGGTDENGEFVEKLPLRTPNSERAGESTASTESTTGATGATSTISTASTDRTAEGKGEENEDGEREGEAECSNSPGGDAVAAAAVREDLGGFNVRSLAVDKRMIVNRKRQIKMYRRWLQAVFEKI